MIQWVLAATFVCGTGVFTACSSSDDDSAKNEPNSDRTEFVQHTRATLKDLSENLKFTSWEKANSYGDNFNQNVLTNEDFKLSFMTNTLLEGSKTIKDVEEGSDLAKQGFKTYMTINSDSYKCRYTQSDDSKTFTHEEADWFEIIFNGINPKTQQQETGIYKLTMKFDGSGVQKVVHFRDDPDAAVVGVLPQEVQFALASKIEGTWHEDFNGVMHLQFLDGETDVTKGYTADATINADVPTASGENCKTQLTFSMTSDRVKNMGNALLCYKQDDRKMVEMTLKESGGGGARHFEPSMLSNYFDSSSSSSIFDLIAVLLESEKLDECKVTVIDDMTATFSVSDMKKSLELTLATADARRRYASQQTVDQYTQQLNEIIKCEVTCKGVNQTFPMRLMTCRVGIDYLPVPAFKFADEKEYVPLVDMIGADSMQNGFYLIDQAVEPMKQSIFIARQLMEFAMSMFGEMGMTVSE